MMHLLLSLLGLLLIHTNVQLTAAEQATILPVKGAGVTLGLFISLGTARV